MMRNRVFAILFRACCIVAGLWIGLLAMMWILGLGNGYPGGFPRWFVVEGWAWALIPPAILFGALRAIRWAASA